MIYIKKGKEPQSLMQYRLSTPNASYDGLGIAIMDDIRSELLREQGAICAYCMSRIKKDTINIEHHIAQSPKGEDNSSDIDYKNMLGVCPGNEGNPYRMQTCDRHRRNRPLTVNPTIKPIVDTILYTSDGFIKSTNSVINNDLNDTLNLNFNILVSNRKSALDTLKKELVKLKPTNTWKTLAQQYIKKLDEAEEKAPYCGILLWYLRSKVK
ncbi:MAG: hypothetical protein FWH33_00705 [Oscillospiraceae bacterium]|nr:hypothetical protein [Oscillospiraceae bacterium]